MNGIWVAVKATTSVCGSSRYTTLKLWKSRPAAPMMRTRRDIPRSFRKGFDARGPAVGLGVRFPLFTLECTPTRTPPASVVRTEFGLPSGRPHPPERVPEVGHGYRPALLPGPGQQAVPGSGAFETIDVVVRGLVRTADLDGVVQEVPGEEQCLVAIGQDHAPMAGCVPGRVDQSDAGPNLAVLGVEVEHVELGQAFHREAGRVAAGLREVLPVGGVRDVDRDRESGLAVHDGA